MMSEEDRLSNLPDDIIHYILSFLDLKYAMQTSALSKKWKLVWTLLPQLNLNSYKFSDTFNFNRFVNHVLLHRNHHREVSILELRYKGAATESTVKSIVNYACFHNVRRLTLVWSVANHNKFPKYLFGCRALKDLYLEIDFWYNCYLPESGWDFPDLEKLSLSNFDLDGGKNKRVNLFSKCVNLKDLTLHDIEMSGLEELNLCVPQLLNLSITSSHCKVLNVVAPQLQNLTASFDSISGLNCRDLLQRPVKGFSSLEKVNLSSLNWCSDRKIETHSELLSVFPKLYSAKFLTLDPYIIKALSSCVDQLLLEPCPFNSLKCLKMNTMLGGNTITREHVVVPVKLKNYFLDKSPSATFMTDYPQLLHDQAITKQKVMFEAKIRMQDELATNQKTMLESKIQMQENVIAEQKAKIRMLEEAKLDHEKLISYLINSKIAELKVQVESGNPDFEVIRSIGSDIKSVMELIPESLRALMDAQFSFEYVQWKSLFLTRIDASQWTNIETELGIINNNRL